MARRFLTPIDLVKNELRNARIQNLASAPANPVPGQVYFDTSASALRFYNGTGWVDIVSQEGLITQVYAEAPITSDGGSSPTIGITNATSSASGAMSAADKTKLDGVATGATANDTDANLRDRTTHTGVQAINTVDGLQGALDSKFDSADFTKANVDALNINAATLSGNTAANLRDRATHTGTQAISTIANLETTLSGKADSGHTHGIADISGLQTELNSKSDTGHGHAIADVSGLQGALDNKLNTSARGAANGVASLDGSGLIPTNQLPALAITETHVVANIAARDALSVQEGDVAIVQDMGDGEPASYIYDGTAWQKLLSPTSGVTAVTGGTGITSTGGDTPEVSITNGGVNTTQLADNAVTETKLAEAVRVKLNAPQGALKHAVTIGDGAATEYVIQHDMGTRDVQVQVFQNANPYAQVETDVELTSTNTATIRFAVAPASNAYRVVIVG